MRAPAHRAPRWHGGVLALRAPLRSFPCGPTRSVGTGLERGRGPASWRAISSRVFSGQTAVPPPQPAAGGRPGRPEPAPPQPAGVPAHPALQAGKWTDGVVFNVSSVEGSWRGVPGSPFSQCSGFHSCCAPLWPCLRRWHLAFQLCVVGASLGAPMEEPVAFSALQGCDRSPSDDSLKKHERIVKLSGMCLMPQFGRCTPSRHFCNF